MWLEQCPFIQQIFAHNWLCVDTVLGTRDLMMLNKPENAEASTSFHSRRREKQITQGSSSCNESHSGSEQHAMSEKNQQWAHTLGGCHGGLPDHVALKWPPRKAVRLRKACSLQSEQQLQRSGGGMLQEQTGNQCGQARRIGRKDVRWRGESRRRSFRSEKEKGYILSWEAANCTWTMEMHGPIYILNNHCVCLGDGLEGSWGRC